MKSPNFIGRNGKWYLVKCENTECGLENYAPAVADGICVWCGYDANKPLDYDSDWIEELIK